ncbi:DUF1262 family protein [Senna tora]|uniref:DUF1262 family protein n=1 Tax=Senna tora TaxID=362788 RepID=A0A834TWB2_9FABA|nr:DUF1262 family protein [Senna tora]
MYVTRPLSLYKKSPEALSLPPPQGPHSGILVIQDDEQEKPSSSSSSSSCFGFGDFHEVKELPFPQNQKTELFYRSGISVNRATHYHQVAFIPVLGHPLSSNLYYVVHPNGKHRGAYSSLEEEELDTFCFFNSVSIEPNLPLDINNAHQVFEIFPQRSSVTFRKGFSAKSAAQDTYVPKFLNRRWRVSASASSDSSLGEAAGVDDALRARLPEFDFSLANRTSEGVVVGKWYCPFMFIKEGTHKTLREEMRKPMFYEMTLEQRWEQVFSCENHSGTQKDVVVVDAIVQKEKVVISGWEAMLDERDLTEGFLWFKSQNNFGQESSVGLSKGIVERMKWEEERFGWNNGNERQVRVKKVEEFEGTNGWKKFGCYVLVERFALKRMDGSLVLTCDFKHTHQMRSKWE